MGGNRVKKECEKCKCLTNRTRIKKGKMLCYFCYVKNTIMMPRNSYPYCSERQDL